MNQHKAAEAKEAWAAAEGVRGAREEAAERARIDANEKEAMGERERGMEREREKEREREREREREGMARQVAMHAEERERAVNEAVSIAVERALAGT